ncbi:hypothetical protein Moror_17375 [Moniliophthora roreri MCA 2997]|uniref:Uncharacterized protein n=2 Tax=Moniliophthora roreri TaxID=221103 RepID=V2Z1C4_MONRO|nr:hypothetical protein Moror_17375 [Moniliophthora roreri MCA 2997]KAI3600494.1 hypothetical protein WG66_001803 [Moniliophthora roreri]
MSSSSASKGKGKEIIPSRPSIPPLPNPATGSANPAQSLPSLWAYITPALDHIVKSPTNDVKKAPAIDMEFYSGVHSACYNYITSQAVTTTVPPSRKSSSNDQSAVNSADLYDQLDKYFADAARELLLGAPQDDSELVHYIIPCFSRYSAGAQSANRLLNYVNRHYVKRAVDEDRGWLSISDVFEHVAKTITSNDTREQVAKKIREKRIVELKKWGYAEGGPPELTTDAETCAEAASPVDRIVHISSLAHRRFRTEFVEPLLAVPKIKGKKGKNKPKNAVNGSGPPGPKGRLARAVKELLESEGDEEERMRHATELAVMLRKVGVRTDHPLRKKLDKFTGLSIAHGQNGTS